MLNGTSGFSIDDWIGDAYPKNIKKLEMPGNFTKGVSSYIQRDQGDTRHTQQSVKERRSNEDWH